MKALKRWLYEATHTLVSAVHSDKFTVMHQKSLQWLVCVLFFSTYVKYNEYHSKYNVSLIIFLFIIAWEFYLSSCCK